MADHSSSTRSQHFADLIDAVIEYASTHSDGDDTGSLHEADFATVLRAAADRIDPDNAEPVVEAPVAAPAVEPAPAYPGEPLPDDPADFTTVVDPEDAPYSYGSYKGSGKKKKQ